MQLSREHRRNDSVVRPQTLFLLASSVVTPAPLVFVAFRELAHDVRFVDVVGCEVKEERQHSPRGRVGEKLAAKVAAPLPAPL